jgi:hypothetical protein
MLRDPTTDPLIVLPPMLLPSTAPERVPALGRRS